MFMMMIHLNYIHIIHVRYSNFLCCTNFVYFLSLQVLTGWWARVQSAPSLLRALLGGVVTLLQRSPSGERCRMVCRQLRRALLLRLGEVGGGQRRLVEVDVAVGEVGRLLRLRRRHPQ